MTTLTAQQIEGRLTAALATIDALWDHMLTPPAKRSSGRGGGVLLPDDSESAADTPRVVDVIDHRHRVALILNSWCRAIITDHNVTHGTPSGHDVPGMAGFIRRWSHLMAEHEAATNLLDELETCANVVRRYAEPQRRTWIALGPCPLAYTHPDTGDATTCPGQVRSDEDDAEWATCNRCGERAVAAWWEEQMFGQAAPHTYLTTDELRTFLHRQYGRSVTRETISRWVKAGTLPVAQRDEPGVGARTWFERTAVVYAMDMMQRRERTN